MRVERTRGTARCLSDGSLHEVREVTISAKGAVFIIGRNRVPHADGEPWVWWNMSPEQPESGPRVYSDKGYGTLGQAFEHARRSIDTRGRTPYPR